MRITEVDVLLTRIRTGRVGVIGDVCLDGYWEIDERQSERSVETGLRTRPVHRERSAPGGAGNVAGNLTAMGVGSVSVFGVVGSDMFGGRLREALDAEGVATGGLLEQTWRWATHTYIKPLERGVERRRFDFGNFNHLSNATARRLIARLVAVLPDIDVLVINQQVRRGIHASPVFRTLLQDVISSHPQVTFLLDSRHSIGLYTGVMEKIDLHQMAMRTGCRRQASAPGDEEICAAARELSAARGSPVFVTMGARGCLVIAGGHVDRVDGIRIEGKVDPVGAGDSMVAGIAAVLAAGGSPATGAAFGALVAAVTVRKIGRTGTASPEEIRRVAHRMSAGSGGTHGISAIR